MAALRDRCGLMEKPPATSDAPWHGATRAARGPFPLAREIFLPRDDLPHHRNSYLLLIGGFAFCMQTMQTS